MRPRAHELESESRNRFEAAILAQRWLVRDLDGAGDYGIDQEVEIFEGGQATGLIFRVQTKAAARPGPGGPYRDIAIEHFNYWSSMDTPVLLVLWIQSENELYARWVHKYDFGLNPRGLKTRRVRFSELDRLLTRLPELPTEVRTFRGLAAGQVPRRLPLSITSDPDELRSQFVYKFRRLLDEKGLEKYVKIVDVDRASVSAKITDLGIRVELPVDAASVNVHTSAGYNRLTAWPKVFGDILIGAGVLIADLGATGEAMRLFRAGDPDCYMMDVPSSAATIANASIREGDISVVLPKILELLARGDDLELEVFEPYFAALHEMADKLSPRDLKRLGHAVRTRVESSLGQQYLLSSARLAHNIASVFGRAGGWELVESFLDAAVKYNAEEYGRRSDVSILRGNARWHQSDLEGALSAYLGAQRLGAPMSTVCPPLSDVLMELGRFKDAADLIDEMLENEGTLGPRTALRRVILAEIIEGLQLDSQHRSLLTDEAISAMHASGQSELVEALRRDDALDVRIWALLEPLEDGGVSPLGRWALAAFRSGDAGAWFMTLVLSKLSGIDGRILNFLVDGLVTQLVSTKWWFAPSMINS